MHVHAALRLEDLTPIRGVAIRDPERVTGGCARANERDLSTICRPAKTEEAFFKELAWRSRQRRGNPMLRMALSRRVVLP